MTEVKEKKKPIGLLVLTLICLLSGGVKLIRNIELINGKDFSILIPGIISLTPLLFLILYCTKEAYRNKKMLLCYLSIIILMQFIGSYQQIVMQYNLISDYSTSDIISNLSVTVISCIIALVPRVLMLLNLLKSKKSIEYILLVYFICLIILEVMSTIININNCNKFGLEFDYIIIISGYLSNFHLIWLWSTQIAQHITFKEKIRFDFKPIQKKVAVTETTLEELKLMYDNGTISENEYNRRKAEIISKL